MSLSLQTLCAIHLLIEKVDKDDKLLDLFPDLIYTLLMQLGSSQGSEAVPPVLKTWRLIHTGTLPEDINQQRCSQGLTAWGAGSGPGRTWPRNGLLEVPSTKRPSSSPPGGKEKFQEPDLTTLPHICPAWCGV